MQTTTTTNARKNEKHETIRFTGKKGALRVTHYASDSVKKFSDSTNGKVGEVFDVGSRGFAVRFGMSPSTANVRGVFPVSTPYAAWELACAGMVGEKW